MQRIFFLIVSVLFVHNVSTAQVTNVIFLGSASVSGGQNYPYKLYVSDTSDVITGYSITDIMGPDETKTYMKGTIDRKKKTITFRETKIIYTKSKAHDTDFCFLHAKLKAGNIQGANTLRGNFTAYRKDGKTECAKGKLMLVCAQDALDKLLELAEKQKIPAPDSTPTAAKPVRVVEMHEQEVAEKNIAHVMPGRSLELSCPSQNVKLELWDAKTIDGDNVTLMQDNKVLLDQFTISGTRKSVPVPMGDSRRVILRLIANNEGSEPMNTARIKVVSGNEEWFIDATTNVGKDVEIILNRK